MGERGIPLSRGWRIWDLEGARLKESPALRAIASTDGMAADDYPFHHEFPGQISTRIVNEIRGIIRIVSDVTSKPAGTSERE
nr:hypothetical protein [Inquilinus limosus]